MWCRDAKRLDTPGRRLAKVSPWRWVGVRGRTTQQRPLDTRVERDVGGRRACRGSSETLWQEMPLPPHLYPPFFICIPFSKTQLTPSFFPKIVPDCLQHSGIASESKYLCSLLISNVPYPSLYQLLLYICLLWPSNLKTHPSLTGAEDSWVSRTDVRSWRRRREMHTRSRRIQLLQTVVKMKKTNQELRQTLRILHLNRTKGWLAPWRQGQGLEFSPRV